MFVGLGRLLRHRRPDEPARRAASRRTREALRAAEKELLVRERLAEAGRVSASLAHEIRNPLAAISGSVQVLKKELALSPEQRELMGIVLKESERVSQSLEQFLDFALPAKQVFSPINLGDLMDETVKILRAGGELNGKVELLGNFRTPDVPYVGNAGQFKQVFWNLVKNAAQGHARGRAADPRPPASPDRKEVRVVVADTGRGLTRGGPGAPLRALLFRVRERPRPGPVHRPQDRRRLRRPASTSGPSPSEGTEVVITLPRPPAGGAQGSDAMETILIIDDEKSLLDLLTVVFKKEGYAVQTGSVGGRRLRDPGQGRGRPRRHRHQDARHRRHGRPPLRPARTCPTCRSS
ncbi:MAG: hypothetical protein MZU91_00795 [Desulfosudis oleivorans]|nr:hypothetical protein [Desulfosudis oleivorans]